MTSEADSRRLVSCLHWAASRRLGTCHGGARPAEPGTVGCKKQPSAFCKLYSMTLLGAGAGG